MGKRNKKVLIPLCPQKEGALHVTMNTQAILTFPNEAVQANMCCRLRPPVRRDRIVVGRVLRFFPRSKSRELAYGQEQKTAAAVSCEVVSYV